MLTGVIASWTFIKAMRETVAEPQLGCCWRKRRTAPVRLLEWVGGRHDRTQLQLDPYAVRLIAVPRYRWKPRSLAGCGDALTGDAGLREIFRKRFGANAGKQRIRTVRVRIHTANLHRYDGEPVFHQDSAKRPHRLPPRRIQLRTVDVEARGEQ